MSRFGFMPQTIDSSYDFDDFSTAFGNLNLYGKEHEFYDGLSDYERMEQREAGHMDEMDFMSDFGYNNYFGSDDDDYYSDFGSDDDDDDDLDFGKKRRRGNSQAAKAMRLARDDGISLKEAWAIVKGGKSTGRKRRRKSSGTTKRRRRSSGAGRKRKTSRGGSGAAKRKRVMKHYHQKRKSNPRYTLKKAWADVG